MHSKSAALLPLLLIVLLTLVSCATLTKKPEPPTVTLKGLNITKVDFFEQRFELELRLQNPNDYMLPVRGLSYELLLAGTSFATGVSASNVDVPALGEAVIKVDSVTNLFSLFSNLQRLGKSAQEAVDYQLKGNVSLLNQAFKLPFNKIGSVSLK